MFIILFLGHMLTRYPKTEPILTPTSVRLISRLTMNVCMLAMILNSLGSSVNREILQDAYPVLLVSFSHLSLGYLVSVLSSKIVKPDGKLLPFLHLAVTFPNIGNLPFLLFQTLCSMDLVNDDFGNDKEECIKASY